MYLDRYLRLIAGIVVLASVALAYFVDIRWLLLTSFVGASLLLGGTCNWCPMISLLRAMGVRELPSTCARP